MTNSEFRNEFDVLYNNIASNQAPGLDDYEKSVFLTQSEEELIISAYNGKNAYNDSFERTEEVRRYLDSLIRTAHICPEDKTHHRVISKHSQLAYLPDNLWFITYESAQLPESTSAPCLSKKELEVVPVTQDEFNRIKGNPFRGANDNRVLRLDAGDNLVELVSNVPIQKYIIRYMAKVKPIILSDLGTGLSINGESQATECELNPALHRTILNRAVQLAVASFTQKL